jgi:hypothetical protein
MKVLFLNHKVKNCGVYQYGIRVYDILKNTPDIEYIYKEIDSYQEYISIINRFDLSAIIYNFHHVTMSWLNSNNMQRKIKNIGIPHESSQDFFDIICDIDPDLPETRNRVSLPRPIFENIDSMLENYKASTPSVKQFIEYAPIGVPIFGSFGFGFLNKGFDKIVTLINEQYDEAIIKFVIPCAHFDPNSQNTPLIMRQKCMQLNKKPNIRVFITHEFFTTEDVLLFLQSNTINLFMYDEMHGRGISSTIDYAMSVRKPIGISNSYMFRNVYSDNVCLYKTSVESCIATSVNHFDKYLKKYSHFNMIDKFRQIIMK